MQQTSNSTRIMSSISSLEILPVIQLRLISATNLLRCLKLRLTSKMIFLEEASVHKTLEGKVAQAFIIDPNCPSISFTKFDRVKKFKNCWKTCIKKIDISSKITLNKCYDFQLNMSIFPFVCILSGNNFVLTDLLWKNRWRLDYLIPLKVHRKLRNWNNKLNYYYCVQPSISINCY